MKYTRFEKARIIGSRALQLAMGAPLTLKLKKSDFERIRYSPIEIAKLEYEKELIPITVKRCLRTFDTHEKIDSKKPKGEREMKRISSTTHYESEVNRMDEIEEYGYPESDQEYERDPDEEENW